MPSSPPPQHLAGGSAVAVHGATGVQGRALARRLVAAGHRVRGLARAPHAAGGAPFGVEPVAADLLDADALALAYAGADAVVVQLPLVAGPWSMDQAAAVAVALRRAGIPRVVFLTAGRLPPAPVGDPFLDARLELARALEESPAEVTVIEPAAPYMENLSAPWSAPLVAAGVLAYPLPAELPIPWVTLEDVAEHAALAVASPGGGGRVTLCGPSAPTGPAAAAALERALGRPIRWETLDPAAYGELVRPHLGDEVAQHVADVYDAVLAGPPPPPPDPSTVRLGRTDLTSWARGQAWQRPAGRVPAAAAQVAG